MAGATSSAKRLRQNMILDLSGPRVSEKARWKAKFLSALRNDATIKEACARAGVSRKQVLVERTTDPEFAEQWQEVTAASVDEIERMAFQRARQGSDQMIIFMLRAHRPETYNSRRGENVPPAPAGNNIATFPVDLDKLSNEDLETYYELVRKMAPQSANGTANGTP